MKTLRIEKVAILLNLSTLEEVRLWCKQNNVIIWKVGILEFVIESEFQTKWNKLNNVELKINEHDT